MATITRTGSSDRPDTRGAATDAVRAAMTALAGAPPTFGLLFVSSKHPLEEALKAAREVASGVPLLACTTAGEFTERGLTHGGMAVMMVSAPESLVASASADHLKDAWQQNSEALCAPFREARGKAASKGFGYGTTITLVDGLSGMGEKLIRAMVEGTQVTQQVVGGAAGDDGAFKATWVGDGKKSMIDGAVALHTFGARPWGIGVGHGLEPSTPKMNVTKAKGNVVMEIDGKPAFEAYRAHAKSRGIILEPKTAGEYMITNEIGIFIGNQISRARAPLTVGDDLSLTLAADVPQGASVCILSGKRLPMIEAARASAKEALAGLEGGKAAGALVFDCICRGMILKEDFQKEIDAVASELGGVPVAGFLTYGEIANYKSRLDGWHNSTAVVLALPA